MSWAVCFQSESLIKVPGGNLFGKPKVAGYFYLELHVCELLVVGPVGRQQNLGFRVS